MTTKLTQKLLDKHHMGSEPILTSKSTNFDLHQAYNWYNYLYNSEDAKKFTLDYLSKLQKLKSEKSDVDKLNDLIKKLKYVPAWKFNSIGWNMKMLDHGSSINREYIIRSFEKLKLYASSIVLPKEIEENNLGVERISIQDRIRNKASDLIGQIEEEFDVFFENKKPTFNIKEFMLKNDVKQGVADIILSKFRPRYNVAFDAYQGKNSDLVEEFSHFKKSTLKNIVDFYREIIMQAELRQAVSKASRKPRTKKQKSPALQVAKLKYKEQDKDIGLTSIKATDIIGAEQLWVYNTKTKTLSVYNASSSLGFTIKGSKIFGFDEKLSVSKRLRKPDETLKRVTEGGKVILRKLMDSLTTKQKEASGRINMDTILVRALR